MKLEVLSDAALRGFGPERLIKLIARVQRHIDTAVAYQRRLIAMAEQSKAARAVGDIDVADSLVRETGISRRRARQARRQAKTIAAHPEVAEALAEGAINAEQAEAIARARVTDTSRSRLLRAAVGGEHTDATRLRIATAETAERDETPEQRFMRQYSKRFLRFYNDRDGMVCMQGALDPESGARLKAVIASIANRMWRKDKRQPRKHRRTPEQRGIDALCTAAASQPEPPARSAATPASLSEPPARSAATPASLSEPPARSAATPASLSEPPARSAATPASLSEPPSPVSGNACLAV